MGGSSSRVEKHIDKLPPELKAKIYHEYMADPNRGEKRFLNKVYPILKALFVDHGIELFSFFPRKDGTMGFQVRSHRWFVYEDDWMITLCNDLKSLFNTNFRVKTWEDVDDIVELRSSRKIKLPERVVIYNGFGINRIRRILQSTGAWKIFSVR
jgi:hypothetical protein